MSNSLSRGALIVGFLCALGGCATQKESHTARTGVEQLLISSAVDQSLDKVDLTPLRMRRIFLETKYLDCVDKNYIIVAMHQRLMAIGAKLMDKPEDAETIVEIASGGVGTDGDELFVGVPEIPLPPPSPVAIPKLGLFTRNKMNGTAKLLVVAYDAKSKTPVINRGNTLARSDQKTWHLLATGTIQTGTVPEEIAKATGEVDFNVVSVVAAAKKSVIASDAPTTATVAPPAPATEIRPAVQRETAPVAPNVTTTQEPPSVAPWPQLSTPPATEQSRQR